MDLRPGREPETLHQLGGSLQACRQFSQAKASAQFLAAQYCFPRCGHRRSPGVEPVPWGRPRRRGRIRGAVFASKNGPTLGVGKRSFRCMSSFTADHFPVLIPGPFPARFWSRNEAEKWRQPLGVACLLSCVVIVARARCQPALAGLRVCPAPRGLLARRGRPIRCRCDRGVSRTRVRSEGVARVELRGDSSTVACEYSRHNLPTKFPAMPSSPRIPAPQRRAPVLRCGSAAPRVRARLGSPQRRRRRGSTWLARLARCVNRFAGATPGCLATAGTPNQRALVRTRRPHDIPLLSLA